MKRNIKTSGRFPKFTLRTLILLMTIMSYLTAFTHDFEVDGICYNKDGTNAIVTYRGLYYNSTGNKYSGIIEIPETVFYEGIVYSVVSIGDNAFYGSTEVTAIHISNSVISIGEAAFRGCKGLTGIEIPNSVTSLGVSAFRNCTSLKTISLGSSISRIGEEAFCSCIALIGIELPNSVTFIGKGAFKGCSNLTFLRVDSDNLSYDSRNNCNAIIETESNTLIAGCKSTEIPYTVTGIDDYAFDAREGLTNIVIPDLVTYIGDAAFNSSSLTSVTIGNSVTTIGQSAFSGCYSLSNVILPSSLIYIEDYAFAHNTALNSIEIPNSVRRIGKDAFWNCLHLRNIIIHNSVTFIGEKAFYDTGTTSLMIAGEGEWSGANFSSMSNSSPKLFIDSKITSLRGLRAKHSDVYCYASVPPSCDANTFNNYNGTLHVPASSLAAYFTAEYWSNFANIVGDVVEPNDVNISNDTIIVQMGASGMSLSATVSPSNATPNTILWQSTNNNVAIVNTNGWVNFMGVGECDIIAQCLTKKAFCHIVVTNIGVTITLDQNEAMLLPNHILTLTPNMSNAMPDLAVNSSNPNVAVARVVGSLIQVVGIKEGTTTITVGSTDGMAIPATCVVTVYTESGDLDCDGYCNISDVTTLIDYLLSGNGSQISLKNADVDGDGKISISDVTTLIDILLRGA